MRTQTIVAIPEDKMPFAIVDASSFCVPSRDGVEQVRDQLDDLLPGLPLIEDNIGFSLVCDV